MAMPMLGEIGAYEPNVEEWPNYVERFEGFLDANGITEDGKKRSVFIAVVGPKSYNLLRNLVAPTKPSEKTLADLLAALSNHYNPTPSEVMQRFRFNTRTRKEGESVADYLAALRHLAEFCNFGDTLEKMLRDRLVCGINDEHTQKKLLAETALTYEKALTIAQGSETATRNPREMRTPSTLPPTVVAKTGHVEAVARKGTWPMCARVQLSSPRKCPKARIVHPVRTFGKWKTILRGIPTQRTMTYIASGQ